MQKALVAFDSKQLCTIVAKMLQDFGFEAFCTQNFVDFKNFLNQNPIVVFCDWNLEGQETQTLVEALKEKIPFIFISATTDGTKMQRALDFGVKEYIMKPFDNDILQSKLSIAGLL